LEIGSVSEGGLGAWLAVTTRHRHRTRRGFAVTAYARSRWGKDAWSECSAGGERSSRFRSRVRVRVLEHIVDDAGARLAQGRD